MYVVVHFFLDNVWTFWVEANLNFVLLLFAYIYIIVRGPNIKVGGGRWYLISPDYPTTFFYKIFYRKLKMEQQEPTKNRRELRCSRRVAAPAPHVSPVNCADCKLYFPIPDLILILYTFRRCLLYCIDFHCGGHNESRSLWEQQKGHKLWIYLNLVTIQRIM